MTQREIDKEYCKLRDTIIEDEFKGLSDEQREAVLASEGPVLLIAGPGSGKTTVIVNRVYNLIKYGPVYKSNYVSKVITKENLDMMREYQQYSDKPKELADKVSKLIGESGVNPHSILTLTFNKAAQLEMEKRFQKLYGSEVKGKVHFATLHSFCNRVVRDYERMKGQSLRRIEGIEEDINKKVLIKDLYYNINNTKINDDELDNLINEMGFIKNKMIKNADDSFFSSKKFSKVYKAYEEYKKSKLMIDFDDMLTCAYSILSKYPAILHGYRSRYKYIQVDEGQDLSNIQFEILKLLAGSDGNIFIVADDDQSIYGFRGAEPQYILNIGRQFDKLRLFRLENNYRSSANIVDLSSKFIAQNKKRYQKSHKTCNKKECDPMILCPDDEIRQKDVLFQKLDGLMSEKRAGSIAVLYRNNLSSILAADKLQRNGIGFRIRQNRLFFFKHWLVQEVSAFLMFALDGYDIESFTKICFRMNRFISKTMLECAIKSEESDCVIDRIINNHDLKPFQLNAMRELKSEFTSLAKKNPWAALEYIKNNFGYLESIREYSSMSGQSFEYLSRLYGILQGISGDCPTISAFLVRLQELNQMFENGGVQKQERQKSQITLSTLHSSKGLEYDSVFMIDLMNSEIPGDKALENQDKSVQEEERRLFYVGMTRARRELYLLCPSAINNEKVLRSIFVKEVVQLLQKDIIESVGEGQIVNHVKFGKGVVIAINDNSQTDKHTIEIKFFNGGSRKLDFKLCLDNKLLSFE